MVSRERDKKRDREIDKSVEIEREKYLLAKVEAYLPRVGLDRVVDEFRDGADDPSVVLTESSEEGGVDLGKTRG